MFQLFQNDHSRTFAEYETISVQIKWPRGPFRLVVASRKRGQQVETRDTKGMNHTVCAAGKHDRGITVADHRGGFTDRLATGTQAV